MQDAGDYLSAPSCHYPPMGTICVAVVVVVVSVAVVAAAIVVAVIAVAVIAEIVDVVAVAACFLGRNIRSINFYFEHHQIKQ